MRIITIVSICICILFTGCSKAQNTAAGNKVNEGNDEILPADTEAAGSVPVVWVFDTEADETGIPQTDIKVQVNGGDAVIVQHGVGEFSELQTEYYARHGVPENAITACSGYWAGFLHVMYIAQENDMLVIMDGGQDEGSPRLDFMELMRIPFR